MPSADHKPQNTAPAHAATDPWDAETAEALTRSWEQAAAEAEAAPQIRAPLASVTPPASAEDEATAHDRAWLDERLGNVAARLQQALTDIKLDRSAMDIGARLDNFEARLDAALTQANARSDFEGLRFIEAHIREIDGQFEEMRAQLSRLDAIDSQLTELRRSIEQERSASADAMEVLVESAIERAANRFAEALPTVPAEQSASEDTPMAALEAQLDTFMGERRRSEEETSDMLGRIEATLGRLVDRVEAIETASTAIAAIPPAAQAAEDPRADDDRLAEAYTEGARALGQIVPRTSLHAADYIPSDMLDEAAKPAQVAAKPDNAAADHAVLDGLRASAARAKLKADGAPPSQPPATGEAAAADTANVPAASMAVAAAAVARRARTKPSAEGRWRRSFFLISGMVLLGGASYLAVDRYLSSATAAPAKGRSVAAETPAAARRADAKLQDRLGETPAAAADDRASDAPGITPIAVQPGASPAGADAGPSVDMLPATIAGTSLRRAAIGGDPAAEFEIGARFAEGRGVTADWRQAFAWYRRAAMRGYLPAQFRLAALYERGIGVDTDIERAKVWYRRAAEQGHAKAMHNLAVLIIGGRDDADFGAAARWFKDAAERGLADSQYNLAVLCEGGRGVAKDLVEAYKWYALASRSGDQEAGRRLERLKSQLTPSEFTRAERLVTGWKPKALESAAAGSALPGT